MKSEDLPANATVPEKNLTVKQMAAITALLTHPNIQAAAAASNLHVSTLHRYLTQPAFKEALRQAASDAMRQALGRVQARANKAIDTLEAIADNPEESGGARVAASRALLDGAFKAYQVGEIEGLMAELRARQAQIDEEER